MARTGIIQISDTQFGPKHVFQPPTTIAKRLVDDILTCADKYAFVPSYLICSGDLAETGTADQFSEASVQIEQIASGISVDKDNVLFVPGNHDVNRELAALGPKIGDNRLKLQCYDKFCSRFYGDQRNLDEDVFQVVIDHRIGVAFLLINSCEKEDHEIHLGSVCLEKLLRTLELPNIKFARQQRFLTIAVLHHRVDSDGGEAHSRVDNADEVASILVENGFQLTVTGHIHSQIMNSTTIDGKTMLYSGCGSTGVDKSQRPDGVPNQYSIHILDSGSTEPQLHTFFRAYNPRRKTKYGLGGWTTDTTYENDSQTYTVNWRPNRQFSENQFVEDAGLSNVLGIAKNPFTVSNAEKFSNDLIVQLFVQDEERHRAALRLTGDAIIRGSRGSGKTMCLKYLDAMGSIGFRSCVETRQTAECFPVLVNLGQLHVADREDIANVYEAAESLIVQQTLNALETAVEELQSTEFKAAVARGKERFKILTRQEGSAISHLGTAINEHLSRYFDHVLLLIDEIAPVFPRIFFTNPDSGFGKWMNAIRNSGPYNTRITVYPNDVSDTLNEDRFGSIVNLNFDPRVPEELSGFRAYGIKLFNVYMKSVAPPDAAPTIEAVLECRSDPKDALEQLLYAANGSSRRLMRLFEKGLALRCRNGREDKPLDKEEVFELITDYSVALVSSYSSTEQQLAASIAKACKKASTFRFRLPYLSDSMKRLCMSREETNIASIIELGTGNRATAYEFNFPYCVQMGIPTHHLRDTARINHERDVQTGEWIHKITGLNKEDLEVFQDEERTSGRVAEVDGELILIRDESGREFYSTDTQLKLNSGDAVSFIGVDDVAEDLLLVG